MTIAVYTRVSSRNQNTESQLPDLKRWVEAYADKPVRWYTDTASGKKMDRPGWDEIMEGVRAGKIKTIVCWRLDRLGRTAKGLTTLFDELIQRDVSLVSVKDGLDLSTTAGRLIANVLASVAQYETEIRAERIRAGIDAAKARGKRWGGGAKGRKTSKSPSKKRETAVCKLFEDGWSISAIASEFRMSRVTIYKILERRGLHEPKN